MKKFGFTLAEVLITMGIIGIIAAITAPSLTGLKPDSNKAKMLKAYHIITNVTKDVMENKSYYYNEAINPDFDCEGGLSCHAKPLVSPFNTADYEGTNKFPQLFLQSMDIDGSVTYGNSKGTPKYTTVGGMYWDWYNYKQSVFMDNGRVRSTINHYVRVDVDGKDKGSNCVYSSSCKKPDRFEFDIDNWGHVTGVDPLTKAYLLNPTKLNDKKTDFAKAKTLE